MTFLVNGMRNMYIAVLFYKFRVYIFVQKCSIKYFTYDHKGYIDVKAVNHKGQVIDIYFTIMVMS